MTEPGGIQEPDILPPPPEDPELPLKEGCRLWIGNLDSRITEFSMLKIVQKYGHLNKFDFIYHKKGPEAGTPRGYCFATFSSIEEAEKARVALDGKMALSKKLVVRYANAGRQTNVLSRITASTTTQPAQIMPLIKDAKIREIEAKLKMMEKSSADKGILPSKRPDHPHRRSPHGTGTYRSHSSSHQPYSKSNRTSTQSHSRDRRR